ncbi:MAG: class I SAM-dependent methyltransferase, partial [Flavobacteriales bacterium]|nr:class I SAM-dependent methyltransferase [Flavobacteriales bacterium]
MAIRKWHLKAIVQKCISVFPNPERVNNVFQRHVTQGIELDDDHFGYKIEHARDHISYVRRYLNTEQELEILELGTGWYPIIPISMYLSKVGKVTSIDIQSWLTKESFITALRKFKEWRELDKLSLFLTEIDDSRWSQLMSIEAEPGHFSLEEINEIIGLQTLLLDARDTDLPEDSFDFICSNNTFEHVYPEVLKGILTEFKRLLRPEGLMSHFIDLSDHFAHFDESISIYNFLKYSKKRWRIIDNSIQPQNRLRWKEYLDMYGSVGLPITEEETRKGNLDL